MWIVLIVVSSISLYRMCFVTLVWQAELLMFGVDGLSTSRFCWSGFLGFGFGVLFWFWLVFGFVFTIWLDFF